MTKFEEKVREMGVHFRKKNVDLSWSDPALLVFKLDGALFIPSPTQAKVSQTPTRGGGFKYALRLLPPPAFLNEKFGNMNAGKVAINSSRKRNSPLLELNTQTATDLTNVPNYNST